MKADGVEPQMPDNPAPGIIDYLHTLGWAEPAGMDRGPISWATMQAWQQLTGTRLKPWEAKLIRRLSSEYLAECRKAENPLCPAPWVPSQRTEEAIEAEVRRLEAVLG